MEKLCKDCKHYNRDWVFRFFEIFDKSSADRGHQCRRPEDNLNLVTGNSFKIKYCESERISYLTIDTCGIDGKYFEPKV